MAIRLAAIDALRRVPCHLDGRDSVLSFYRDAKHDSELRIGAYLAAMQCPSAQLLEEMKQALISENVNQVNSFVWTHLTNLQETSSPSKQAVRQLLHRIPPKQIQHGRPQILKKFRSFQLLARRQRRRNG